MGAKIAVVVGLDFDPKNEVHRELVETLFINSYRKYLNSDTIIDFYMLKHACKTIESFGYDSVNIWGAHELFEAVKEIGKMGYNAIIPHCSWDPHLYALRQILDVPVVGLTQSALMTATYMGAKFGVVSFHVTGVSIFRDLINRYGFKDSAVPTRVIETTSKQLNESYKNPKELLERVIAAGQKSIRDGAEVLVPG